MSTNIEATPPGGPDGGREPSDAWKAYQARSYFPELDGLRAVSILGVVTVHMHDERWLWTNGYYGVTVFFVLSGYLITTLALREERRRGKLCFSAFYIRRTFRIFPAYYLTLGLYAALILGLGFRPDYRRSLIELIPYYLSYFQEVAKALVDKGMSPASLLPFGHSWSLGIEEKFYLVWPVLAFGLWWGKRRARLIGTLMLILAFASAHALRRVGLDLLATVLVPYYRILVGCLVAILLDDPAWFDRLSILGRRSLVWPIAGGLVAIQLATDVDNPAAHFAYTVVAGALLVGVIAGRGVIQRSLASPPLVTVGRLSYGVYLLHMLAMNVAEKLVGPGTGGLGKSLATLAATWAVALTLAFVMSVTVERPCIAWGRRLSEKAIEAGNRPRAGASTVSIEVS